MSEASIETVERPQKRQPYYVPGLGIVIYLGKGRKKHTGNDKVQLLLFPSEENQGSKQKKGIRYVEPGRLLPADTVTEADMRAALEQTRVDQGERLGDLDTLYERVKVLLRSHDFTDVGRAVALMAGHKTPQDSALGRAHNRVLLIFATIRAFIDHRTRELTPEQATAAMHWPFGVLPKEHEVITPLTNEDPGFLALKEASENLQGDFAQAAGEIINLYQTGEMRFRDAYVVLRHIFTHNVAEAQVRETVEIINAVEAKTQAVLDPLGANIRQAKQLVTPVQKDKKPFMQAIKAAISASSEGSESYRLLTMTRDRVQSWKLG